MQKVLLTCESSAFGGVERRLLSEAKVLKGLGAEVVASVPRFPGVRSFISAMKGLGAEVMTWNPYKFVERQHPAALFSTLNALFTIPLIARGITFASVPLVWTTVGLSRAWVLKRAGIPYILSFRNTYPRANISARTRYRVMQALSGMVGAYGVSNAATASFLDNFGDLVPGGFPIPVIRNGVDLDRFAFSSASRSAVRQDLGFREDDFAVVVCGRLDPIKRPGLVLDAMGALVREVGRARLVVVGDGSLRTALEQRAQSLGIADRVRMVGFSEDVPAIYSACDAYVSAGFNEGSPSATIEALATSLPIVVTDDAPNRELFDGCDSAAFVATSDPLAWARAMHRIAQLEPPSQANTRHAARDFAVRRLGKERMVRELQAYYGDLLGGRG
jgi:glycosyltransferase involved in cell wall biosynthesis